MSYHVQQNNQQKSLGICTVIIFHLVLIWGLASGLGNVFTSISPKPIILTPTPKKAVSPEILNPDNVVIQSKTLFTDNTRTNDTLIFDPETIVDTGGGEVIIPKVILSKPRLIRATKPDYPAAASRLGEEGATGLNLYITAEGRVGDVQIFSSSGSTRLDDAAIKHAKRNWAFTPCMEGDKAVACWHQTKLVWRLEGAK